MSYSLHPGAEQDLSSALSFLTSQAGPSVASRFLDEFERVALLLDRFPDLGTTGTKGRRSFPMRTFHYLVVYRSVETGIRILIVRHQHRKPNYGAKR